MVIADMKSDLDKKQFGNKPHRGIQHYLIRLVHRVLTSLDQNSKGEIRAVLCLFVDYKQAFSRQCHTLGIKSFIENGVRPSLIPILMSYFEDRQMRVKWHGELSQPRKLPGGGAMGATLGIWEYLSQTNHNADCIPEEDSRVPPFWQFLDAIFGCLTKDVAGQYKVNAKKLDFSIIKISRRRTVPFLPIFGKKRHCVAIFWPKKISKRQKNFKKILNGLKIIVEQKEKRFWKT